MTRRRYLPVAVVRLQMLNDVFADGADGDGLALSEVNQVGGDLRAVVTRGVPGNAQAGGRRVERRRRPGIAFLLFICIHRGLVPLQLGLLQRVDVADGCRHRAGGLAQHCLAEGAHTRHVHSLHNNNNNINNTRVNANSYVSCETTRVAPMFDHKVECQCKQLLSFNKSQQV